MNTIKILLITTLAMLFVVSIVQAPLPKITATYKTMFKNMVKNYFHPVINGWGIGFDCDSDEVITAKFHVINVRTIPRVQVTSIIREAKAGNATDWATVRDRIRNVLETGGNIIRKGRVEIDREKYILTNIETGDTVTADIKEIPNYTDCKEMNKSYEECEDEAEKVGDLTLTRREQNELPNQPKLWVGTMDFNDNTYKFAALAYPRW